MDINFKQIQYNISTRTVQPIYIVIHDTGNRSKGANANAHFSYFNSGNRDSSADFFVDDIQVLQANDYTRYYTWHCGDGHGKYGVTNSNSVGIEICINCDGNYSRAVDNAIQLTRQLMSELNIDVNHVVRHYDASRKNCPQSMSGNDWGLWKEFKKRLIESEGLNMSQYNKLKGMIDAVKSDVDAIKNKMVYSWVDDNMPDWAKPTITKLMEKGYLKGDENGKLNLDDNMLRMLVINDRAGLYD